MKDFFVPQTARLKMWPAITAAITAASPAFAQAQDTNLPADLTVNSSSDNISSISHPLLTPRPDTPVLTRQATPRSTGTTNVQPQAWRVTANRMQQADLPGSLKHSPQTVSRTLPYRFNETLLSLHAALNQQGFTVEQVFSHAGHLLIVSPERCRLVVALSHVNEAATVVHICPEQENSRDPGLTSQCEELLALTENILSRRKSI